MTFTPLVKYRFHIKAIIYRLRILLPILCVLIAGSNAPAQWELVAPNLLGPQSYQMSSLAFRSGIVWAGTTEVFMSSDFGLTWTKRSPVLFRTDVIRHINFFDAFTGLVGTQEGHVFLTRDQGVTWRDIRNTSVAASVNFLGSTDNIMVTSGASNGEVHTTRDGGATWNVVSIGTYVPDAKPMLGSGAYAISGYTPASLGMSKLFLFRSNDYGATWTQTTPLVEAMEFDTYTFDVDPCNPSDVYVINEAGSNFPSGFSQIYRSFDGGVTWDICIAQPVTTQSKYFCGSVSLVGQAMFVQTVNNGILRSTDKGTTWTPIGGPGAPFDTRLVCALNGNFIFAADANGSIWRTRNSGGDSLVIGSQYELLSVSPPRLFSTDSLISCDSPIVAQVNLRGSLCVFPRVLSQRIEGDDSIDYRIITGVGDTLTGQDSARISFRPRGSGDRNGYYVIYLDDGSRISIPLAGFGKQIKVVDIATLSTTLTTDTIGGAIAVPITFMGLDVSRELELVVRYDPTLEYLGSYTNDGKRIDAGDVWSGGSRLHFDSSDVRIDSLPSGYSYFTIWPSDAPCPEVSFDSLGFTGVSACEYTFGIGAQATLCPPMGCGIITLTNYIRYGTVPQLRVYPNPANDALKVASTTELGLTSLTVFDNYGEQIFTKKLLLTKNEPQNLDVTTLASGAYYITLATSHGALRSAFVIKR